MKHNIGKIINCIYIERENLYLGCKSLFLELSQLNPGLHFIYGLFLET